MKHLIRSTPESVGIPSGILIRIMKRLAELDTLNSIMVLRHGKVCLESWWKPFEREMPHQLFSLSKSFTSCAVGIAQGEGLLNLSDRLVSFFPEYESRITDPRMKKVTLHDLLSMQSGHLQCAYHFMSADPDKNWERGFLSSPLDTEPGTRFAYNSAATYMLSAVIRKVTSRNVREYLMPRLFQVLDIAPGIWECSPSGTNAGGFGLQLKTEDIAKFAQMILNGGTWNGRRIVPAEYLAEATKKQSDNSMNQSPDWKQGYGYQFWCSQHGFRGDGASGQYAVVLPKEDLAIAVTGAIDNMQDILTAFWDVLLPALHDSPLPEDPIALAELRTLSESMSIPLEQGIAVSPRPNARFEFEDNPASIHACAVEFGEEECSLTFETPRGYEQIRAGFGSFRFSNFQLTDIMPHRTAASAAWKDEHTLLIHSMICDGIYRTYWTIDFSDPVHPLRHQLKCSCFRPEIPELTRRKS